MATVQENLLLADELRLRGPDALSRAFTKFQVKQKDIIRFRKLIERNDFERMIELFNELYMIPPALLYTEIIQSHLEHAQTGQMPRRDQQAMSTAITASTALATGIFLSNFTRVTTQSVAPSVFAQNGITSPGLKKQILDETLKEFNELTRGAMSRTNNEVLGFVRKMQREMVVENQRIALLTKDGAINSVIDAEKLRFKKDIRRRFPDYYKAMEDGLILKSRPFGTPPRVRRFKLDHYVELSTQTTIMNVERKSVEVDTRSNGILVMEYKLIDTRRLKGRARAICQTILGRRILGRALVALNTATARALGVLELEEAKSQGALGVLCRHGLKKPSKTYLKAVQKETGVKLIEFPRRPDEEIKEEAA